MSKNSLSSFPNYTTGTAWWSRRGRSSILPLSPNTHNFWYWLQEGKLYIKLFSKENWEVGVGREEESCELAYKSMYFVSTDLFFDFDQINTAVACYGKVWEKNKVALCMHAHTHAYTHTKLSISAFVYPSMHPNTMWKRIWQSLMGWVFSTSHTVS